MSNLKPGKIVIGSVTGIVSYGVFVNLDEYYNGLIHISEISSDYVKNINDYVNIGEKIFVKVIDVDDESYQVKLSIKDIDYKIKTQSNKKIRETKYGFKLLQEKLPQWVEKKMSEINSQK
ncbi:MAG: S1 RNA-binding domain-containing protein [Bacilli bacterium]